MPSNKLSFLTDRVIPDNIVESNPDFVFFIKSYFEYLERDLGEYDTVANLLMYRDIDETVDGFIEQFRLEKAQSLPLNVAGNLRTVIKNVKQFYKIKGSEQAYKFLFKAIFNAAVEFTYPKLDVLRTSDSTTIISDDDNLVDSFLWQDFSYLVRHNSAESSFFERLFKELLHPAGLKFFTELALAPDVPAMTGIAFEVSLIVLIYISLANWPGVTLAESKALTRIIEFSRSSAMGHSTGWLVANKDNPAIVGRDGLSLLSSFESMYLWQVEGRDGHALAMTFTNGIKDHADNVTAVDNNLSLLAKTTNDVINMIAIPHQTRNLYGSLTADGILTTFTTQFAGSDKTKLFIFKNGKKLRSDEYSIVADVVTPTVAPLNTEKLEWYIVEHSREGFNEDGLGGLIYPIAKNIGTQLPNIHVFASGDLLSINIDYTIDKINNKIIFQPGVLITNEPVELVFMLNPHTETYMIPSIQLETGNGILTDFTLSGGPLVGFQSVSILVDDIIQKANTDYTISGSIISFITPPPNNPLNIKIFLTPKKVNKEAHDYLGVNGQTEFFLDEYVDTYSPIGESMLDIISLIKVGDFYWPLNDGDLGSPIYEPASLDWWVLTTAQTISIGDTVTFDYIADGQSSLNGVMISSTTGTAKFGFGALVSPSVAQMTGFTATLNGNAIVNGDILPSNQTAPAPASLPPIIDGRKHKHTIVLTATVNADIKILGRDSTQSATLDTNQAIGNLTIVTPGQTYNWPMNTTGVAAQPEANVGGNDLVIQSFNSIQWRYLDILKESVQNDSRLDLSHIAFNPNAAQFAAGINQPSMRADLTGGSIDLNALLTNGFKLSNDVGYHLIDYAAGFTIEILAKLKVKPTYTSLGGMTSIVGTSDNINIPIFEMRWDNWAAATPTTDEFRPCFTLVKRGGLYNTHASYATNLEVEVRGTVEPVIDQIYHMIGTLRPSDNTMEFWIDGVSIGTASIPIAWWDNGNQASWGLQNPQNNFKGSSTKLLLGGSINSQTKPQVQDLRIHLVEANQAFASRQYTDARITT